MGEKKEGLRSTLEKIKEISLSRMGMILLAGVVIFLVSGLLSGDTATNEGLLTGELEGSSNDDPDRTAGYSGSAEGDLTSYLDHQEERLRSILEQMAGVGQVEVMMSVSASGEKVVLSDNPYSQSQTEEQDAAGGTRTITEHGRQDATVYESDGTTQSPFVVKELEPVLSGVLILADGAGSDTVKAEIVEAVEALFGLPAHRIKVIKRRG